MSKIETAVAFMEQIAADNSHGYDQATRNNGTDYDCSSLVGTALHKAGYNVNKASTTRNLRQQLINCGFSSIGINDSRQRGDIFLKEGSHVVMCVDANNIVHASINENRKTTGGAPGDQTGKEICVRSWYNKNWGYHFRAPAEVTNIPMAASQPVPSPASPVMSTKEIIRLGQEHANNFAQCGLALDGVVGANTNKAKGKVLQRAINLDYNAGIAEDGFFQAKSNKALGNHYVKRGETQYMVTALQILLMLKGYDPSGVELPGIFGSGLEAAVRQYQKDHGLTRNGIADAKTFKSLIS